MQACGTLRTADCYNERLNLCGGERQCAVVAKLTATYSRFRSVGEEDLDEALND